MTYIFLALIKHFYQFHDIISSKMTKLMLSFRTPYREIELGSLTSKQEVYLPAKSVLGPTNFFSLTAGQFYPKSIDRELSIKPEFFERNKMSEIPSVKRRSNT